MKRPNAAQIVAELEDIAKKYGVAAAIAVNDGEHGSYGVTLPDGPLTLSGHQAVRIDLSGMSPQDADAYLAMLTTMRLDIDALMQFFKGAVDAFSNACRDDDRLMEQVRRRHSEAKPLN